MADLPVNPDELALRRRARRRLVGAVAMALIAVVVLPMIFDPEPKPLSGNVEIVIPAPTTPFQAPAAPAHEVPVEPVAPAPVEQLGVTPPAAPPPHPVVPSPTTAPAIQEKTAGAVAASKPVSAAESAKPKAESKPVTKPEPKPAETKVEQKPPAEKPKPVVKEKPATTETKATAAKPDKSSAPFVSRGYYLQLGSFSSESNARQLLSQVKAAGFPASMTTSGGQSRVRVGPYSERDKALQAQAKLKSGGMSSVLMGP